MKKLLKNIFTQTDNETFSFIRIILIPPLLFAFVYKIIDAHSALQDVGMGIALGGIGLGCLAFLSKFIEDGTLKGIIENFKK